MIKIHKYYDREHDYYVSFTADNKTYTFKSSPKYYNTSIEIYNRKTGEIASLRETEDLLDTTLSCGGKGNFYYIKMLVKYCIITDDKITIHLSNDYMSTTIIIDK